LCLHRFDQTLNVKSRNVGYTRKNVVLVCGACRERREVPGPSRLKRTTVSRRRPPRHEWVQGQSLSPRTTAAEVVRNPLAISSPRCSSGDAASALNRIESALHPLATNRIARMNDDLRHLEVVLSEEDSLLDPPEDHFARSAFLLAREAEIEVQADDFNIACLKELDHFLGRVGARPASWSRPHVVKEDLQEMGRASVSGNRSKLTEVRISVADKRLVERLRRISPSGQRMHPEGRSSSSV
jgi:hypothetical protein